MVEDCSTSYWSHWIEVKCWDGNIHPDTCSASRSKSKVTIITKKSQECFVDTQSWHSASVIDSNKFWFHQSQALSRRILNSINEWRSPGVLLTVTWPSSDHLTFIWPSSDLQLVSTPMSDPAGLYCAVLCCTRAIYCTVHNEQSCFYSMFFFKVSYFEGSFSFTFWV